MTNSNIIIPSATIPAVGIPGPPGIQGPIGPPPITTLTASFVQPAPSTGVAVTVGTTEWWVVGAHVFVAVGGEYVIASITDGTHGVLTNTGETGNAAQGTTINAGAGIAASGPPGVAGQPGSQGPQGNPGPPGSLIIAATIGLLAATSMTNQPLGTPAFVDTTGDTWTYNPGDTTTTADSITVADGVPTGRWYRGLLTQFWRAVPEWFLDATNGNDENPGFAIAMPGVTASVTNGQATATFSASVTLNAGDILFFAAQSAIGYTVATTTTGTSIPLTSLYSGSTASATATTRAQPIRHADELARRLGYGPGQTVWLQPIGNSQTDSFRIGSIWLALAGHNDVGLAAGPNNEGWFFDRITPMPSNLRLRGTYATRIFAPLAGQTTGDSLNKRVPGTANTLPQAQAACLTALVSTTQGSNLVLSGDVVPAPSATGGTKTFTVGSSGTLPNPGTSLAGTVNVQTGSASITFSTAQTIGLGDLLVFSDQPTTYYTLQTPITGATSATLSADYTGSNDIGATVTRFAALSGTLHVTNGSPTVPTTADLRSLVHVGDSLTFANQLGALYTVQSIGASSITLATNFSGSTNTTVNAAASYASSSKKIVLEDATNIIAVQYSVVSVAGSGSTYTITVDRAILRKYAASLSTCFVLSYIASNIRVDGGGMTITGTGDGLATLSGAFNCIVDDVRADASGGVPTDGGGLLFLFDTWSDLCAFTRVRATGFGDQATGIVGFFFAGVSRCRMRECVAERLLIGAFVNLSESCEVDGYFDACNNGLEISTLCTQIRLYGSATGSTGSAGCYVSGATQCAVNVDVSDSAGAGVLLDTTQGATQGVTVGGTFARNNAAAVSIGTGVVGTLIEGLVSTGNAAGPILNGGLQTAINGLVSSAEPVRFDGDMPVVGFTYQGKPPVSISAVSFPTAGTIRARSWTIEYTGSISPIEIDVGKLDLDGGHLVMDTGVGVFVFNINSPGSLDIRNTDFVGSNIGSCGPFNTTGPIRRGSNVDTSQCGIAQQGSPYSRGTFTLTNGVASAITFPVRADPIDIVQFQYVTISGTPGVITYTRVAGTSFTPSSSSSTDNSTIRYWVE